jgi:membrane-associated phospholipid phosphatase
VPAGNTAGVNDFRRTSVPAKVYAAAVLLALFGLLGTIAHNAGAGTPMDHAVLAWLVGHRSSALTALAIAITDAGSPMVTGLLALIAAVLLWLKRRSLLPSLAVVGTLAASGALSTIIKAVVGAHRPPRSIQLITETDMSYPSGHVTGTLALAGIVAVVVGVGRARRVRLLLAAGVLAVAVLVALTRLYLGVHWGTDIGGGLLLGAAAVLLGSAVPGLTAPRSGADASPLDGNSRAGAARVE